MYFFTTISLHTSTYHSKTYRRHILNYVNCTSFLFVSLILTSMSMVPLKQKNPVQTGICPNRNKTLFSRHSGMDGFYCIYMYIYSVYILYDEKSAMTFNCVNKTSILYLFVYVNIIRILYSKIFAKF